MVQSTEQHETPGLGGKHKLNLSGTRFKRPFHFWMVFFELYIKRKQTSWGQIEDKGKTNILGAN